MPMFPKVVGILEQSMQAASLRQQVLANNIANVNVPGFQAAEVTFEEQLQQALQNQARPSGPELQGLTAHERHIPIPGGEPQAAASLLQPQVRLSTSGVMRQDGNNVDVEAEQAKLAANQLWYQSLVRSMQDEFSRLRTAIMEGRR